MSGSVGKYRVGVLTLQADDTEGVASTNFSVARVRRDILRNSDIGAIFINKQVDGGDFNRTYGVDGNFNLLDHLDLTSFLLKTETPGLEDQDMAGSLTVAWNDPRFQLESQYLAIGENFNPEVGFVPRKGIKKTRGRITWTPT